MEPGCVFVAVPLLVFGCSDNTNFILGGSALKAQAYLYPVHLSHTINMLCAACVN